MKEKLYYTSVRGGYKLTLKFLFFFILLSLAKNTQIFPQTSNSEKIPEWITNYQRIFPDSEYIAQIGTGTSKEEALNESLASLSRYFKTEVESKITTNFTSESNNEKSSTSTQVSNTTAINSNIELFGVQQTEPYFLAQEKKWYCVSFVHKATAYQQLKPRLKTIQAEFLNLLESAQKEADYAAKRILLKTSQIKGKEFMEKLYYARFLDSKVFTEEEFSAGKTSFEKIPLFMEENSKNMTFSIQYENDFCKSFKNSVANAFTKAGFTLSKNANYIIYISVEPNETGQNPLSVYPSVEIELLTENEESVFSFTSKLTEKTTSFKLETAMKKACTKLANKIEDELSEKVYEKFGI